MNATNSDNLRPDTARSETSIHRTAWRDDTTLHLLLGLAAIRWTLHLAVNAFGGYEIFRDELYYLACADHLSWGYVDHPPLSIWLLALVRSLIGESLFAIRLIPATAGAALVVVTGLLAREFGGHRFAVALAGLSALVSLHSLAVSSIWSMNVFDLLLVGLASLALARLINTGDGRWWIAVGLLLGLALLNKVGVLWVGLGVFVGVLLGPERRWLTTLWPWLAGGLSGLLFLPYIVWNATHEWAHLEFIAEAVAGKYSGLTAWSFLSGQVTSQNPSTLLIWLVGLGWLLFAAAGRRYRLLGIVWVTACAVLMLNGHSKTGYLANVYPALFAAGGVAWERALQRRRFGRWLVAMLVISGLGLAPLVVPMLPVETYVAYAAALGETPSTDEGHDLGELSQHYADMFGWRSKAEAVAAAYHSLSESEQSRTAIFGENYGRAGAIDYWAEEFGLPPAISNHNSYWWWGAGAEEIENLLILGGDPQELSDIFESVEVAGVAYCRWCIPYERDLPIHLGRGFRAPMESLWEEIRHYD